MGLRWPGLRRGRARAGEQVSPRQGPVPLLELSEVSRRFGEVQAVSGVSLQVGPGEICGLVGPDGAGKTTTLRMAVGLVEPDSGRCLVQGRDVFTAGRSLKGIVGYVSQAYSLYGDLTVAENLWFFGRMYGLGRKAFRERSARLLSITGLGPFRDRRASALSGGMYKKLALACALLSEPEILVMDEPTNGVDVVSRHQLWDLVAESAAQGAGVLVATPLMQEAERCHKVWLLAGGRVVLSGRPEELRARLSGRCWEARGCDAMGLAARLDGEDWVAGVSVEATDRLRIVVTEGGGPALQDLAAGEGFRLEPARPRFEDVYLDGLAAARRSARKEAA